MKVKTYGINGLTEWHGDVKAGSISVRVSFTGGTASPSGAQPAYYVTKDPIAQFVIENSKEYKSGFIHLEMSQEVAGEHPRMAMPKAVAEEKAEGAAVAVPGGAAVAKEKVAVETKTDAIEWLKEHYPERGYTAVKLRSKQSFYEACEECGIEFEITAE